MQSRLSTKMAIFGAAVYLALAVDGTESPTGATKPFPDCIIKDMALRSGRPVFSDVRGFIRHPDAHRQRTVTYVSKGGVVGMLLSESPHDLGEMVTDVANNSQASNAGVRKGWIITEINGQKFTTKERLRDVVQDFSNAKSAGETLQVKYDIQAFLECTAGDCTHSDKFPTDSAENCAEACAQVSACEWWSFGPQDGDTLCWLQSQQGSSLVTWSDLQTAPRACARKPTASPTSSASWPSCQVAGSQILEEGGPVLVDVRRFINHPDEVRHRTLQLQGFPSVGMVLRAKPHDEGEMVESVKETSSAWKAGVRAGWIVKTVDGKAFKKDESLNVVSKAFQEAKDKAPTVTVMFDIRMALDCTNADCSHSDKLPAANEADCARYCSALAECEWWSYGSESGDAMCFLRRSSRGMQPQVGAISGARSCAPTQGHKMSLLAIAVALALAVYNREILMNRFKQFRSKSQGYSKLKKGGDAWDDFDLDVKNEENHGLVNKYGDAADDFCDDEL